jgi:hypothetical protein
MLLCIKLRKIKAPYDLLKTLRKNSILNVNELGQLVSDEKLLALFPDGDGVHFDFSKKGSIIMRPRKNVAASLNGERMSADCAYHLSYRNVKVLTIGAISVKLTVIRSNL